LGLDEDAIDALIAKGIVEVTPPVTTTL
jgi:hypothetical protein